MDLFDLTFFFFFECHSSVGFVLNLQYYFNINKSAAAASSDLVYM